MVTNPKTGAILAMVSKPSYDPNLIATQDPVAEQANFNELNKIPGINLNQNVSGPTGALLAPGSVFKLVDTAAAAGLGEVQQGQRAAEPGRDALPRDPVQAPQLRRGQLLHAEYGKSFAFALQQSCNTPFASIALDLGQKAIADQAEKFGFGQGYR